MKYRPKHDAQEVHAEMFGPHEIHQADSFLTVLDDRCPDCLAALAAHPHDYEPI